LGKRKIVLVSSGQPSLNPRLVKEADALADAGNEVIVIYAYWNSWGTELDDELLGTKNWKAIRAGGDPIEKSTAYFISRLIFKVACWFTTVTGSKALADVVIARCSLHLIREAKKHRADLYIGHNLGALPAVVKAAKKYGKSCGFDAEDFHRNEESDDIGNIGVKLKSYVEDKYIPQLQYLTASSPLIGAEYQRLYPNIKSTTVLNTFPKSGKIVIKNKPANEPIKLFWFSQTVGINRGIEEMVGAIKLLPQQEFELHLLGDVSDTMRNEFTTQVAHTKSSIHFHKPIPSQHIMTFAGGFDIGMASEQGMPHNRNICLTNKLFTYIQAGLPVLVSDTKAQTALMQEYDVEGILYKNNDLSAIADALLYYQNNREALAAGKKHNYQLGQTVLNWGVEKEKFLNVINQIIPGE